MSTARAGALAILVSLLAALALTLMPLPEWARVWRPQWMALVLIYWTLRAPHRLGVGAAWLVGLVMDVAQGALLGQHALGFAVMAYLALRLQPTVKVFALPQQALAVGVILLPYMGLTLWVRGLQGQAPEMWSYWAAVLTSMAVWPIVSAILNGSRPRASMTERAW